jgi:hypothetical protein
MCKILGPVPAAPLEKVQQGERERPGSFPAAAQESPASP